MTNTESLISKFEYHKNRHQLIIEVLNLVKDKYDFSHIGYSFPEWNNLLDTVDYVENFKVLVTGGEYYSTNKDRTSVDVFKIARNLDSISHTRYYGEGSVVETKSSLIWFLYYVKSKINITKEEAEKFIITKELEK